MDNDARARRRDWIRTHHPDVGGDPDAFIAGLAAIEAGRTGEHVTRPSVHRSRRPDRAIRRAVRDLRRRLSGTPPRNLR